MKWTQENRWHIETALERESKLGNACPGKAERKDISTHTRRGVIGKGFKTENAVSIEASFHYNGSGKDAFGGAVKWPAVSMRMGFQAGDIKKRDAFVKKLKCFIDRNYP